MTRYDDLRGELQASPKNWLVTGAAGFIGSAIVETLLELDQRVVGLDNFRTGHQHNLDEVLAKVGSERAARFSLQTGDITDLEACRRACVDAELVLHQAALGSVPWSIDDPQASHAANVNGFLNMMIAARDSGVSRLVYASSSAVYGDEPTIPACENLIGRQLSPYAVTKRINELYAGVVQDCYGFESVGLRYFNVFGRRQDPNGPYAAVIPKWIDTLVSGDKCTIFGDGSATRDFLYVDDAVQANLLAATTADSGATNQVYNVGCAEATTISALYTMIRDALAESDPTLRDRSPNHQEPRKGDIEHSQANIDKLRENLGYEPTHLINAGLAKTVAWFTATPHGATEA